MSTDELHERIYAPYVWVLAAQDCQYGDGRGFLQYRVVEAQRLVVLLDWLWIG